MAVVSGSGVLYFTGGTAGTGGNGSGWAPLATVTASAVMFSGGLATLGTACTATGSAIAMSQGQYLAGQSAEALCDLALAGHRQEAARVRVVRERARERAAELLMSLLTAEQAHAYVRDGWFEARGSGGGLFRVYRRGQQGNVREVVGGREVASFCCHPPGGLPDADAHVAQLLHLQTDEDGFRRTANRTLLAAA